MNWVAGTRACDAKMLFLAYQWQGFMVIKKVFHVTEFRLAMSDLIFGRRLKLDFGGRMRVGGKL